METASAARPGPGTSAAGALAALGAGAAAHTKYDQGNEPSDIEQLMVGSPNP